MKCFFSLGLFFLLFIFSTVAGAQFSTSLWNEKLLVPGKDDTSQTDECPSTTSGTLSIPIKYSGLKATACSVTSSNASLIGTPTCTCTAGACAVTGYKLDPTYISGMTPGTNGLITNAITYSVTNAFGTKSGSMKLTVNAQTWTPTCIGSTLSLWLDAEDTSTLFADTGGTTPITNGTAVALWKDKGANSKDVSQATAGTRPTFNTTGLNSKKAIVYSPSVSQGLTSSSAVVTTNDLSVFTVMSFTADNHSPFSLNGTDGNQRMTTHFSKNPGSIYMDWGSWSGGYVRVSVTTPVTLDYGQAFISGFTNYTASGRTIRANGTEIYSGAHLATNTLNSGVAQIGNVFFGLPYNMNGAFQEFIVNTSDYSSAIIEGYLAKKWGLQGSLPGGHAYKTYAP